MGITIEKTSTKIITGIVSFLLLAFSFMGGSLYHNYHTASPASVSDASPDQEIERLHKQIEDMNKAMAEMTKTLEDNNKQVATINDNLNNKNYGEYSGKVEAMDHKLDESNKLSAENAKKLEQITKAMTGIDPQALDSEGQLNDLIDRICDYTGASREEALASVSELLHGSHRIPVDQGIKKEDVLPVNPKP